MTPFRALEEPQKVVDLILRRLNILTAAVVALMLVVGAGALYVIHVNNQTHNALCNFKEDLENRIDQGHRFLDHPEKFPGVKINPQIIQAQVEGQERTLASLAPLGCD